MSRPADHGDRVRAATEFDRNVVVVAGAGTGKTSLLVERVLVALGAGRVDVDHVAAITFTEKAAGEMRQRLAAGLERLLRLSRGDAVADGSHEADRALGHLREAFGVEPGDVARRVLEALRRLDRARVETIHTFCAGLLREHPVEAGVQPDFVVDPGEVRETVLEEHWERFVERELGRDAPRAALWARVLRRVTPDEARSLAFALASFEVPPALIEGAVARSAADVVGDRVEELIARFDALLERQTGMGARDVEMCRSALAALRALSESGVEAFAAHEARGAMVEKIRSRDGLRGKKSYGPVSAGEVDRLTADFRALGGGLLANDEPAVAEIVEAVGPFALEAREELLRRGYVTFDGLLVLARDLLRDHPAVRARLKARFRMLVVDEFQDTDPLQYEIVLFLGEKPAGSASDAYACELDPGRLFIVGDPKQSIYRFRGADYAAFRRAVGRVLDGGGVSLSLTANFRSVPGILEPVNALFDPERGVCWRPSEYQPDYVPIDAARASAGEGPCVEVWTVDIGEKPLAKTRREAEGKIIADAVRKMAAAGTGYGRISILPRAFTHLSDYLRPLRELGIPFVVDGGREFLARPEVAHLLVVLKSLARPSDPVALLAFLRSPAGAVSDVHLVRYARDGGRWLWKIDVDAGKHPEVARAFALLRSIHDDTRDAPPDEVVRVALERTELLTLAAAAFEGPQRVANLTKLAAAAADLASEGRLSLIEIVEALEQGRTSTAVSDSPLADEETEAVRIMSIHKAKGLENDVVIIPDLARGDQAGGRDDGTAARVVRLPGGDEALAVRVGALCNFGQARRRLEEVAHERAEEIRVLYVGMTRARERLIVLAAPSRGMPRWMNALRGWGYRAAATGDDETTLLEGRVRHLRSAAPSLRGGRDETVPEGAPGAVEAWERARAALAAQGPPLGTPSEEERWRGVADRRGAAAPIRRFASRETARVVGVAAHRALERWDGDGDDALLELASAASLAESGAARVDGETVERETVAILRGFLDSELALRFGAVEILGRELPVVESDGDGPVYRGTLDLLYRDVDGTHVVADYKTDDDTDREALAERYGPQLAVYARAVQKSLGLLFPPRTELWMLRGATRIVLDA